MPTPPNRSVDDRPVLFAVEGLFGRFSHLIPLPSAEKPVRFLSAPNGYGKSTTLRMIDDLARGRWANLANTYFSKARLEFASGQHITLDRDTTSQQRVEIRVVLAVPGRPPAEDVIKVPLRTGTTSEDRPPWLPRAAGQGFHNQRTGGQLSHEAFAELATYFFENSAPSSDRGINGDIARALRRLSVLYLNADRLLTAIRDEASRHGLRPGEPEDKETYSINDISKRVAMILRRARMQYGQAGRNAERTFPARVLQALKQPGVLNSVNPARLQERFSRLRDEEAKLQKLSLTEGVMEALPEDFRDAEPTALLILDKYLDDIEARFQLLQRDALHMSLFQSTVNSMLEGKSVKFAIDFGRMRNGIEMIDSRGASIPLPALSSGEQQLVVMLGRILFARPHSGSLVLLDEPEISLHPQWQISLSRALKEVAAITDCRMLLATHSPTMIDNDWDNEIDLTSSQEV